MDNDTTNLIANIVLRASELCGVSPHDLVSKSKNRKASEARYIVYTYLHYEVGVTSGRIGRYFNRSRINVIRGMRILRGWMDYHAETKERCELMLAKLRGGD